MVHSANEQLRESLSALVDNQASDIEVRRLLKSMETDEALAASWQRYHLASEILRGGKPLNIRFDISSAVAAAITNDMPPAVKAPWQAWLGKSALAASVALAVLVGVRQFAGDSELGPVANSGAPNNQVAGMPEASLPENAVASVAPESSSTQSAPAGFVVPVPDARTVSSNGSLIRRQDNANQPLILPNPNWRNDPALQQELNQLLIDHASRASANGSLGILPFARVSSMKTSGD